MARSTFHFAVIDLDAVVEAVRGIRRTEIMILVGESGVGHGKGMVVGKIGADVFNGDTMGDSAVMAFAAAYKIVSAIESQVQCRILTAGPTVRLENRHIQAHGAIVAGQAEETNRAWGPDLVVQGTAVIKIISTLGRDKTVPSRNAALAAAVSFFTVRRKMAVNTRRTVVGESDTGHGNHTDTLVEAGKVMFRS